MNTVAILDDLLLLPWTFLIMAAVWVAVVWLVAKTGGWQKLARRYTGRDPVNPVWKAFQYGRFGWAAYKGCLKVGVSPRGLSLVPHPYLMFGFCHPPLFIPWSEIERIEETRQFLSGREYRLQLRQPSLSFYLRASALDASLATLPPHLSPSPENPS